MLNWIDNNPKNMFLLIVVVLYVVSHLLVTKYYLPDVKVPEDFKERHNVERGQWTFNQEVYDKWGEKRLDLAGYYMDKVHSLMKQHNIKMHISVYPWPEQIIHNDLSSRQVTYW